MMNVLMFLFRFILKLLVLPVLILMYGVEKILTVVESMSSIVLLIYNLLLVFIISMILFNKMWDQLWGFALMVALEGFFLVCVGVARGVITVCREKLAAFVL